MTETVYISVGNSDDKLTQREWSDFLAEVEASLRHHASSFHGVWHSAPTSRWQNACFCVEFAENPNWPLGSRLPAQRHDLRQLAQRYRQDSIVWAEVGKTEFLTTRDQNGTDKT